MAGFHELDRLENDGRGAAAVGGANGLALEVSDGGVDDRLELGQKGGVGEDQAAQGGAVERAIGAAVLPAEAGDDGFGDRGARRHELPRQLVGVDDCRATVRQPAGHGRLAGAYRPDQPDQRGSGPEGASPRPVRAAPLRPRFRHGAASSISSHASSAAASASFTAASSPLTRRNSTKLPCTLGSCRADSRTTLRSLRRVSSSSI